MRNKRSQQGIALIWLLVAGALLLTSVGVVVVIKQPKRPQPSDNAQSPAPPSTLSPPTASKKKPTPRPSPTQEQLSKLNESLSKLTNSIYRKPQITNEDIYKDLYNKEPLLKVLPPKERRKYGEAIRQAQEALKNVQPYNPSDIVNTGDIIRGLEGINQQTQKQLQNLLENNN